MRGVGDRTSVMVTGGAGYIGSHVVLALVEAGYDVIVIDNLSTGFRWAVTPPAIFIEGNVDNQSLVRGLMELHNVQAVMHLAGSEAHPALSGDPLRFYRNNTAASQSLIESAISCNVPHFVLASTAAVYGTSGSPPFAEGAECRPADAYARSKLMVETMLNDAAAAFSFNYAALRYFNVAGADPQGRTGQSTRGAPHLIKSAVECVLGKRDHVEIYGTGVRDYIHVSDLAAAHVAAFQALMAAPSRSLTLNCGYGRGHSVLEVLDIVEHVTKVRVSRREVEGSPIAATSLVADNRALLSIRWQPRHASLEAIVRDAFRWEMHLPRLGAMATASEAIP